MHEEFDDSDDEFYDPSPPNEEVMTINDVMKELGVSRATVHNWRKKNVLTAYRIGVTGNNVRFKRAEVMALLTKAMELKRI